MRFKIVIIVFITLHLVLIGCNHNTESSNVVQLSDNNTKFAIRDYSTIVDSLEFVPLETVNGSLLGNIKQLLVENGKYYICDEEGSVKCFSKEGKYLFDVGKKGRGRGEYSNVSNICYDAGYIFINNQSILYQYNADDGSYKDMIRLPEPSAQVVVKDNYIYCYDVSDGVKLYCYTADLSKKKMLKRSKKGESVILTQNPIVSSGSHLLYCDPLRYIVYELFDGRMQELVSFNFGENGISEKQIKKGVEIKTQDGKAAFFGDSFIAGNILSFNYTIVNQTKCIGYINLDNYYHSSLDVLEWLNLTKHVEQIVTPVASDGHDFYVLKRPVSYNPDYLNHLPKKYSTYNRLQNIRQDDNMIVVRIHLNDTFLK